MPRYRVQWSDIPWDDRASYPANVQGQLDQKIDELRENPKRSPARYHPPPRDYWMTSYGTNHEGWIMYVVRDEPTPVVTILRLTNLAL